MIHVVHFVRVCSYVGDHVFSDVSIAKASNRWRTLLILQVRSIHRNDGTRTMTRFRHCRWQGVSLSSYQDRAETFDSVPNPTLCGCRSSRRRWRDSRTTMPSARTPRLGSIQLYIIGEYKRISLLQIPPPRARAVGRGVLLLLFVLPSCPLLCPSHSPLATHRLPGAPAAARSARRRAQPSDGAAEASGRLPWILQRSIPWSVPRSIPRRIPRTAGGREGGRDGGWRCVRGSVRGARGSRP